jgi:hypothetical protein
MDVSTPARGKKKLKICTGKKKDVAFGGALADLDPGVRGALLFHMDIGPRGPWTSPSFWRTEIFTLKGLLAEITKTHLLGGYFGCISDHFLVKFWQI